MQAYLTNYFDKYQTISQFDFKKKILMQEAIIKIVTRIQLVMKCN